MQNSWEIRDEANNSGGGGFMQASPTTSAADPTRTSGFARCSRCSAQLAANAAFCQTCGQAVNATPSAGTGAAAPAPAGQVGWPATQRQVRQFVLVTGRARTAGWLVLGGGAALLLSAVLPWFSFLGIVGVHLPVVYFLGFGAVGAVLAYFGIRALMDRVTRAIMTTLWVLAAIAAFIAVGLFVSAQSLGNQTYGTVTPASGFYIGLLGLVVTVIGTIVLQVTRRSSPAALQATPTAPRASRAVQLSQDGAYWWDGTAWRSVTAQAPPNAPRSPDGNWWWDGAKWRPVPSVAPGYTAP